MSGEDPRALLELAKIAQRRAADPRRSVWVSANAGAGKTRVLVDRVTRLLLDGARPHAILCLTFTKAAAAEMRARLADRLGAWAAADDASLRAQLADIADGTLAADADMRRRARRLFAETLDAPGGLRVQTIHSFCESLLKRFPLEAGLSVHFSVAGDTETSALLAESRTRLFAMIDAEPRIAQALDEIVGQVDAAQLDKALEALASNRRQLRRVIAHHGGDPERVVAALSRALAIAPETTRDQLDQDFAAALPHAALARAARALAKGSPGDIARAQEIVASLAGLPRSLSVAHWFTIFLTDKEEVSADRNLATKTAQKADGEVLMIMQAEAARCVGHVERRRVVGLFRASAAMIRLGSRLMTLYDEAKRARGLLDYDDLIFRSLDLLQNEDAAWVRYKLDGGIDHVLVDEAQDTSSEQWRLVTLLVEEFFAGEGIRGAAPRTLFAVGDEKQSIFSFQGADPQAFAGMRQSFADAASPGASAFDVVDLAFSFRSSPTVLDAIDTLFGNEAARRGVADGKTLHRAVRAGEPGLVELWPLVEPRAAADDNAWDAPLDYQPESSPTAQLATRIATTIRSWLDSGECLAATGAAIRAGDVMILVRRRNAFFVEMVRALKACDVPVAGADRLVLADHVAVQDLMALGRFVLLPQDDYSLACVLKSPLLGFDDDDLMRLRIGSREHLWPQLQARRQEAPRWSAAVETLANLLRRADRVPPFEFYARLLGAERGRERFLGRLGHEAADPLDEFMALALAFEHEHAPSLQAFLQWLERGGAEIKRDMEQARDEVRVMTVHAAKGLEAPIVFLPDTATTPGTQLDPPLQWPVEDGTPLLLWPARRANRAALSRAATDVAGEARLAEYRRLLYVATTRARDRLYVCGWRGQKPRSAESWHALAETALRADPRTAEVRLPSGDVALRLAPAHAAITKPPASGQSSSPPVPPAWSRMAAPDEPRPPRPLAPSAARVADPSGGRIGGAAAAAAARRGRVLHRLFELLPDVGANTRHAAARRLIVHGLPELDAGGQDALIDECLAAMALVPALFGPQSRAEVALAGLVGRQPVAGQIDRLVVMPGEILIVDFKSSRLPPCASADVPAAYVAQLALYRACLAPIYPHHQIRAFLLWTATPQLMELPAAQLDAALGALQVTDPKSQ